MKFLGKKIHFIGIGGIGMCGLAELYKNLGAEVSGSDVSENQNTLRLKKMGILVYQGHEAENIKSPDVVVYSSAIQKDNCEILRAKSLSIPLIPRAEALGEIMRFKRGIAVAGTHGKTTTTSMVASVFLQADLDPTIVIGGRFSRIDSTAQLGEGDYLIAEADESDGSFSKLTPEIAIITNIDNDHLDYYKSFDNLLKAFYDFALKVPFYGAVIACGDDEHLYKLLQGFPKRVFFYGFHKRNDLLIYGEKGLYELKFKGEPVGSLKLEVPGRHNALNAAAAVLAGLTSGLAFSSIYEGIRRFQGVDRRFHFKGEARGVLVYDDYGHHPTEVRAVLEAFKEQFPDKRLQVFFQPHRFSRTRTCWYEFLDAFSLADRVYILPIYAAGELAIPGVDSVALARAIKHQDCSFFDYPKETEEAVASDLGPDDIVLTLGAGDGYKFGLKLLEKLKGL